MKNTIYVIAIIALIGFKSNAQTITDIDGNVYNIVTIGTQTWMQENLKTTRFNNGIVIPTTSLPVYNDTTALYQWAYNDDTSNINIYGRLYTWNITNSANNVCPVGWKVPDNSDWDTLRDFLGGELVAGGKMKELGTTHWLVTDSTVSNSSGFTGLGSGTRGNPSGFNNLGSIGTFWSSTPFGTSGNFPRGFGYRLNSADNTLVRSVAVAQNGKAIRCIQCATTSIKDFSSQREIQIFPNPATDRLFIGLNETGNYRLSVCDMIGNTLYEQKIENEMNSIDITFLPKGAYLIKLISEHQIFSYKFIKQ